MRDLPTGASDRERAFDAFFRTDALIRAALACRAWEFAGTRLMVTSMIEMRERLIQRINEMDAAAAARDASGDS